MISKLDQETQVTPSKELKLMLRSSPVDIGHSRMYQNVQFHLNLSKFRTLSTHSTRTNSPIDRSTIYSRMV